MEESEIKESLEGDLRNAPVSAKYEMVSESSVIRMTSEMLFSVMHIYFR